MRVHKRSARSDGAGKARGAYTSLHPQWGPFTIHHLHDKSVWINEATNSRNALEGTHYGFMQPHKNEKAVPLVTWNI